VAGDDGPGLVATVKARNLPRLHHASERDGRVIDGVERTAHRQVLALRRVARRAALAVLLACLATLLAGCTQASANDLRLFAPTALCADTLDACTHGDASFAPFNAKRSPVHGRWFAREAYEAATLAMPLDGVESVDVEGGNLEIRAGVLARDGVLEELGHARGHAFVHDVGAHAGDRLVVEVRRHAPASWIGVPVVHLGPRAALDQRRRVVIGTLVAIVGWLAFGAATLAAQALVGRDRRASLALLGVSLAVAMRDILFLRTVIDSAFVLSPGLSIRVEYATVGAISGSAAFFCREVTKGPERVAWLGKPVRAAVVVAFVASVVCMLQPTTWALRLAQVSALGAIIAVVSMTTAVVGTLPTRELTGLSAGFAALAVGSLIDIAANVQERPLPLVTGFVVYGSASMIFAHAVVLAFRAAATHDRAERLAGEVHAAAEEVIREHERTNEGLRRIDRLKDEFMANTSHELRTPLNGILGLVEATLDGEPGALDAGVRRNLELVYGSARRLAALVNDILDFAKLRRRAIELRLTSVDLYAAVTAVLETLEPLARDRGLELENRVAVDVLVRADEARLQQILMNLVGNALKFTNTGFVSVWCNERDGRVHVSVTDSGVGIPREAHERIFESFEQGDGSTARSVGGTGLGLAIAKSLVREHHGALGVRSAPGEGSTFTFDVASASSTVSGDSDAPSSARNNGDSQANGVVVAAQAAPVVPPFSAARRPSRPPSMRVEGAGVRVLVADDEPVNREVLAQHLTQHGYQVALAKGGVEALEVLRSAFRPDVVILDVMMPDKSGYDVLEVLRADPTTSGIPVILLTAKAREDDLARGFELGASDYLAKPVALVELEARLGHQVRILQAQRALEVHARELERTVALRTRELHDALAHVTTMHDALKAKDDATTRDLLEARRFQELARTEFSELSGFEIVTKSQPAALVGGDWIDVRALGPSGVRIFLADATGHGVQAALRAMVVKTMYDRIDADLARPAQVLDLLNRSLSAAYPDLEAKVDAACVDVLVETSGLVRIRGAQAGGVAVGVAHASRFEELRAPGLPLGVGGLAVYSDAELEPLGDPRVVVMSDGVLEQCDAAAVRFEWEGVEDALRRVGLGASLADAAKAIVDAWSAHRGAAAQEDDATCVLVARKRSENRS
jgi:signal transduction histidine kinase/CheY-like chemotaxis protein